MKPLRVSTKAQSIKDTKSLGTIKTFILHCTYFRLLKILDAFILGRIKTIQTFLEVIYMLHVYTKRLKQILNVNFLIKKFQQPFQVSKQFLNTQILVEV